MSWKMPLIIPVENQVRELDPKLLLACIAARRGFTSIIGSHREIDFRIASFPQGMYLNKSMTERNLKMFKIMHRLGHKILTWDEEALVHLPPEIYYSRRLSPAAIRHVSHLFAWGEDNAELWRRYPYLPKDLPIHITGNPRNDMLRPELQAFHETDARSIVERHGDFILVNTNFNHVNAFFPAQNLFKPVKEPGKQPQFGKAGVGMTRQYAEGLRNHKQAIFESFQAMIPELAQFFPKYTIVIRPHPTEGQEIYKRISSGHDNVHVTNEGNVVPWLMAAKALVHNGCTTGVEAFVMGTPAITYRAVVNEDYDSGFYLLPNLVSRQCFNLNQLQNTLQDILVGKLGAMEGPELIALTKRYLAARDGPLACDRIVNVLEEIANGSPQATSTPLADRATGWALSGGRRLAKYIKSYLPGSHAPQEFHRHRYPGISLDQLRSKIERFQEVLCDETPIGAEQLSEQIFRISAT